MNLLGINLNRNKKLQNEITKIYGIGKYTALKICQQIGCTHKLVKEVTESEFTHLNKVLTKIITGDQLKKIQRDNIQHLINIRCYKGIRHLKKLPVRGQRTRTNAKTAKKRKLYN
ncbi:ribosomal protein uS13 [Candidatus Vidania fulgoroideorum]